MQPRRCHASAALAAAHLAQVLASLLERLPVELAQLLQALVVALVAADVEQRRACAPRSVRLRAGEYKTGREKSVE